MTDPPKVESNLGPKVALVVILWAIVAFFYFFRTENVPTPPPPSVRQEIPESAVMQILKREKDRHEALVTKLAECRDARPVKIKEAMAFIMIREKQIEDVCLEIAMEQHLLPSDRELILKTVNQEYEWLNRSLGNLGSTLIDF